MEKLEKKIPSEEEIYEALEKRQGKELQRRFKNGKVAICGLGGLGSNIAVSLVRAGVGHLHLIDFDVVDISNLNRQQYFASQIGIHKTEALKENLLRISPYVKLTIDTVKLNEDNIKELLKDDHIICEAFDNAEQKAMLVNQVLEKFPDKFLVSSSGMAGMDTANTIRTRKVGHKFYMCGDRVSAVADDNSLVSSRVMICAAHEAHMVLRILGQIYEA